MKIQNLLTFFRAMGLSLLAGVLAILYVISIPNYYKSEARILPVDTKGSNSLGGIASAAAAFGVSLPVGEGNDNNAVDILSSRWLREQLIQSEYTYMSKEWMFGPQLAKKGTLINYMHTRNTDKAVAGVGGILTVTRDIKSRIIFITAETTSPDLSQQIVNRSIELLEKYLIEKNRTRGKVKAAFANARLEEAKRELWQVESDFKNFLERNKNYQNSGAPSVRLDGLHLENELKLRQLLVTSITSNREQALLEEKNDMPIINVMDSGNLPIDKSKPARLVIVLYSMAIVGMVTFGWRWRNWVLEKIFSTQE